MRPTRTIGLIIEGVGATGYTGTIFYFGDNPGIFALDYQWVRALTQVPQTIDESCVPLTGQIRSSLGDFQITRTEEVAALLLDRELRTSIALAADYTPGDGSIVLNTSGLTGLIWVDDECLQLGAESPSGTYVVTGGIAETDTRVHFAGAVVWRRNPYLWRRRFRLFEYKWDAVDFRNIARGSITKLTEDSKRVLTMSTVSLPSLISGGKLNKGARRYQATGLARNGAWSAGSADLVTRIHRDPLNTTTVSTLQVAGTLANGKPGIFGLWRPFASGSSNMPLSVPPVEEDEGIVSDNEAREVFYVAPGNTGHISSRGLEDDLGGASRHRLALAYGFLRAGRNVVDSAWDRWSAVWGMGLRPGDLDGTKIQDAIKASAPDVDQLVLGWDGEEVGVEDLICNTLLLPGGYHLATTEEGRIYFAALRMPSVDDLDNAPTVTAIPPNLSTDLAIETQFDSVTAEIGGTPWAEPDRLTINIVTGQRTDATRSAAYESSSQFPIDYQTVARSREDIIPEVLERLGLAARGMPRITITALPLVSDTYDLGRWYLIDIPVENWWIVNGVETSDPGDARRLGYLVSRRYNIAEGTYDLEFLSHKNDGRIARLRAPAGVVNASATSATITLLSGHGIQIGEIVDLCASDGVVVTADLEVTGRTGTSITVDSSVAFTDTQIVRLTSFATYTVDPRRWVYIADRATELIDGTDEADIYG